MKKLPGEKGADLFSADNKSGAFFPNLLLVLHDERGNGSSVEMRCLIRQRSQANTGAEPEFRTDRR